MGKKEEMEKGMAGKGKERKVPQLTFLATPRAPHADPSRTID